jgi:uncharacterized protein (DUF1697 family)
VTSRTTFVALLRGINVGGHRRVGMGPLRGLFESLGHGDVTTYIQSGNVVFDSPGGDPRALADEIELRILEEFGFGVDVVVRTADEMATIVSSNPFLAGAPDTKGLHVAFARDPIEPVDPSIDRRFAPDEFSVASSVVYLRTPAGFGTSRLTDAFLKRVAGSLVTTRNWNTVTKLAELGDRRP